MAAAVASALAGQAAAQTTAPGGFTELATSVCGTGAHRADLAPAGTVHVPRSVQHRRRPPDQCRRLRRQRLRELRRLLLLAQLQQPRRQRHHADRHHAGSGSWRRRAHAVQLRQAHGPGDRGRPALRSGEPAELGHRRGLVLERHAPHEALRQPGPAPVPLRCPVRVSSTRSSTWRRSSGPTATSGRSIRAATTECIPRRSGRA